MEASRYRLNLRIHQRQKFVYRTILTLGIVGLVIGITVVIYFIKPESSKAVVYPATVLVNDDKVMINDFELPQVVVHPPVLIGPSTLLLKKVQAEKAIKPVPILNE